MSRILAAGLMALALAACKPVAEPAPPAEPAAPSPAVQTAADAAWTAEQDRYLAVNVQPSDPLEAVLWRGVRCDFLSGEFGNRFGTYCHSISAYEPVNDGLSVFSQKNYPR